jgi:hypothetical protein
LRIGQSAGNLELSVTTWHNDLWRIIVHTKQIGALGEMKIAADLIRLGYYVFEELGDNSKVDLIALGEDYKPIKIQVKTYSTKNGKVHLSRRKAGPNYSFKYESKHADVFAIYLIDEDKICYVSANTLLKKESSFTIRIKKPANNQLNKINMASEFYDFKEALRDCTCDTLTDGAEGNETVQHSKPFKVA